ncbi:MAG TPA: hypothetical protein VFI42_07100, partial [Thermomicrobiaceae bacterium]|nr:hypothetical protein [Thermomicrobiaceae bacterium]
LATGELSSRVDGILTHTRESVDVRGLPDQIPTHFEVDVSQLDEVDAAILVSDLTLPPGIEMLTPAEEILIKVAAPSRVAEPAAAAEEALAEQTGDMPQEATEGIPPVEEPGA